MDELVDNILRSFDAIRSSPKKLRSCISEFELPPFLRKILAFFMQRSIGAG